MKHRRRLTRGLLLLEISAVAFGCATPQQRIIEPNAANQAAGESPATGDATAGNDNSFVLSRKPVAPAPDDGPLLPVHTGDLWWGFRASFLGLTDKQVRDRDAAILDTEPPDKFWDAQSAIEAASLWSSLCNECHGGRRKVEDALAMPPPPKGWGRGEGLFFGKRRPYAQVFAVVYDGGPPRNNKRSEMPPWRGKIAREQIWSLLYFLVYQSGGVEGPFPPSLQPRQSDEIRRVLR